MTRLDMPPRLESSLLCELTELDDERRIGGKAANLARLSAMGMPVPPGVVLTCEAFGAFLSQSRLGERLDSLCGPLDECDDPAAFHSIAAAARALVMEAPLPICVDDALEDAARLLLAGRAVAVRSSAVGEDGAVASFAGQFDSMLDVYSLDRLREAVRVCYASYWSARALFYRRARRIAPRGMAVIIQRQATATVAGVLFTRNPQPEGGAPDTVVVEYCRGLADRLVSGRIDPGRFVVCRSSGAIIFEHRSEEEHDAAAHAIVAARLPELVRLALGIEQRFGAPQDIEWTIDDVNAIWLVQSRAITAEGKAHDAPASRASVLWTNANVSENYPYPISPLLYSFAAEGYYHYFRNLGLAFGVSRRRLRAMEQPLRSIIGVHGARMYYNLTHIHAVLRMAPCGDRLAVAFNTFVGADQLADSPPDAASWRQPRAAILQWLELGRIAACTVWQYMFLAGRIATFERAADGFAGRARPTHLEHATLPQLGALLASFVDIRYRRWKNASLADAAAMVTYAALGRLLARVGFDASMQTRLLRALPHVPSSEPARRLWVLSREIRQQAPLLALFNTADAATILKTIRTDPQFGGFRRSFERFLDAWGFRSSAELMLTEPALDERPEPAIDLLREYARDTGPSPAAGMQRQADERRRDTRRVLSAVAPRSPLAAALLCVILRWTQRAIAYRERARLKQALLYTRCRRIVLAIGRALVARGQLSTPDDVFMLTVPEVLELTSGHAMFPSNVRALVALRQRQLAIQSRLAPPDTFRLTEGDTFAEGAAGVNEGTTELGSATILVGTTACGGQVSSRAAVLRGLSEAARLTCGDILVTRQTDPGWGPVFCLVSGLIIERGGMLSHGAIIAREFGVPCIVGVKNASARIPHGARLHLEADRGRCVLEAGI